LIIFYHLYHAYPKFDAYLMVLGIWLPKSERMISCRLDWHPEAGRETINIFSTKLIYGKMSKMDKGG